MNDDCDLVIGGTGAIGLSLVNKMVDESSVSPILVTNKSTTETPKNIFKKGKRSILPFQIDSNQTNSFSLLNDQLIKIQNNPRNIIFSCFVHDLNNQAYLEVVNAQFTFIANILQAIDEGREPFSNCRNLVFVVPMSINKDLATCSGYFVLFKMLRQLVLNYIFKFGKKGILCNFVSVGILDEGFGGRLGEKEKKDYLKHCSLKRFGKVEEVVDPILWLIRKNTLIQGQVLTIDGGL